MACVASFFRATCSLQTSSTANVSAIRIASVMCVAVFPELFNLSLNPP